MNYDRTFDHLDEWRRWPIHAVSGIRHDGRIFTTARIRQPEVRHETVGNDCTVQVTGSIPVEMLGQGKVLEYPLAWQRRFTITQDRLQIETRLRGFGENKLSELVETIPVYLRDMRYQRKLAPTQIEFRVGETWIAAVNEYQSNVTAVRLSRFDGKVRITFARPRRVKLSSADWQDTYMSRAACRNVMIDLPDGDDSGVVFHAASTSYAITSD